MANESKLLKRDARSRQILTAALRLVRDHGTAISTAQIAGKANCSKETLYNWFEDRDGIFRALITEQAKGMNTALNAGFGKADGSFQEKLHTYCTLLLDMMTGDAVVVVNRIAMAQTCANTRDFGATVLTNWREQIIAPFVILFEEGNRAKHIDTPNAEEAFDVLVGLLLGDRQRRLLLGENARPSSSEMPIIAQQAVDRFLGLYSA